MVTLNKSKTAVRSVRLAEEATTNLAGGTAFKMDEKNRLIERTVGAFWSEDLFYAKGSKVAAGMLKDVKAVAKTDPKFVLQLAAWARNDLYLRTTPQVLLVEAANIEGCKPFVREYTPKIVKRADELAEVIAYQLSAHGKPIPNSLKKGLADAFAKFDEYQLNKYDSDKGAVSLGDVLRLIARHEGYPVSKALWNYLVHDVVDEEALPQISALKQLLSGGKTLDDNALQLIHKSHATWETVVSHFGSTKEVWESVIPNMGYMALLRNLRNFEQKGVDLTYVLQRIADPNEVKRSKQLPFRFYSAYNSVTDSATKRAISRALEASISNVNLEGKSAIIVDLSGSMTTRLSDKSDVSYRDIASLVGAIAARKSKDSVVIGFADFAKVISLNPDDTLMTNMVKINKTNVGGSTNAWEGIKVATNQGRFDRFILISDMQCYQSSGHRYYATQNVYKQWHEYSVVNPNAWLYSMDLSAYGTKQAPTLDNRAVSLFGWSDKVLDFIRLSEKKGVVESEIKKW